MEARHDGYGRLVTLDVTPASVTARASGTLTVNAAGIAYVGGRYAYAGADLTKLKGAQIMFVGGAYLDVMEDADEIRAAMVNDEMWQRYISHREADRRLVDQRQTSGSYDGPSPEIPRPV